MNYSNIRTTSVRNESMQRKVDRIRCNKYDASSISRRLSGAFEGSYNSMYTTNLKSTKPQALVNSQIHSQEKSYHRAMGLSTSSCIRQPGLRNMNTLNENKYRIGSKYR